MRSTTTSIAAALVCAATCANAQVPEPKGADFEALAYDAALCGTTHLGYYQGDSNKGHVEFTVEQGPEGSGATYRVTIKTTLSLAVFRSTFVEVVDLDASLARLRSTTTSNRTGDQTSFSIERRKDVKDGWRVTGGASGKRETVSCAVEGKDYSSLASQILIARKLGQGRSAKLQGVTWPPAEIVALSPADAPRFARPYPIVAEAGAAVRGSHRGQLIDVYPVTLDSPQGALNVRLNKDGELLGYRYESERDVLVAGTKEQARADCPGLEDADVAACRKLMRAYTRVACGEAKPSVLDPIVDWSSVRSAQPLEGATVETYPELAKRKIQSAAEHAILGAADYSDMILIGKDQGVVAGEFLGSFGDSSFRFARDAQGQWRITRMPLVAPWVLKRE